MPQVYIHDIHSIHGIHGVKVELLVSVRLLLIFRSLASLLSLLGLSDGKALSLRAELKYAAAEIGLDNYIVSGKPHTWSAFTFVQMRYTPKLHKARPTRTS